MEPRFQESDFTFRKTNEKNQVLTLQNVEEEAFARYRNLFLAEGYEERESYGEPYGLFSALEGEKDGIFLHYFSEPKELILAKEEDCTYFEKEKETLSSATSPLLSLISLTDFGLSMAVRLSDGRFLVFDGGWDTAEDRDSLYRCLVEQSEGKNPHVACWILTHPHGDHHRCFKAFWEEYEGKAKIDSVLLHFPDAEDVEQYPSLATVYRGVTNSDAVKENWRWIRRLGVKVYTAHVGQIYNFADAKLKVLSCMENTIALSDNINASSLVLQMDLAGQRILFGGDAYCKPARLAKRYGKALKSDILQVFHHGFSSGKAADVIEAYEYIRPATCILPTTPTLAYSTFCIHQAATRHLFDMPSTLEVITGEHTRAIPLPYTPAPNGREALLRNMEEGLRLCGKYSFRLSPEETKEYLLKNITFSDAVVKVTERAAEKEVTERELTIPRRSQLPLSAEKGVNLSLESSIPLLVE